MRSRPILLAVLLVLTVSLAGCNFKDWYNQVGVVRVELEILSDENIPEELGIEGGLSDFQTLRFMPRQAQVRQLFVANPHTSPMESDIRDAVELAKSGERVLLLEEKMSLRGLEQVLVRIEALDGVTAAGQTVPGCERGQRVENPPCIRYDRAGAYSRPVNPEEFAIPRGGTLTVVFPIGVGYNEQVNEYYIFGGVPRAEQS